MGLSLRDFLCTEKFFFSHSNRQICFYGIAGFCFINSIISDLCVVLVVKYQAIACKTGFLTYEGAGKLAVGHA